MGARSSFIHTPLQQRQQRVEPRHVHRADACCGRVYAIGQQIRRQIGADQLMHVRPGRQSISSRHLAIDIVERVDLLIDPLRSGEVLAGRTFRTHLEARTALFDSIEGFSNRQRRHSALGYQSPDAFERSSPTTTPRDP